MGDHWYALVFRVQREIADELASELAALGRGVESRRIDARFEERVDRVTEEGGAADPFYGVQEIPGPS